MLVGYARTSTAEQVAGVEAQLRDLSATGCNKTFQANGSPVSVASMLTGPARLWQSSSGISRIAGGLNWFSQPANAMFAAGLRV